MLKPFGLLGRQTVAAVSDRRMIHQQQLPAVRDRRYRFRSHFRCAAALSFALCLTNTALFSAQTPQYETPPYTLGKGQSAVAQVPKGAVNLVPNGDASRGLEGWHLAFPYFEQYVKNHTYIKLAPQRGPNGKNAILIDLPPGVVGGAGGRVQTGWIKAEPGATYVAFIACMTNDANLKLFAEAFTTDPDSEKATTSEKDPSKRRRVSIMRYPAEGSYPPLAMCYRAQFPDPPEKSKAWTIMAREFTIPTTVTISGREQPPEYLCLKAHLWAATQSAVKGYVADFRLYMIK
jgi:hypothetical protein